jgi:hypothetical protein
MMDLLNLSGIPIYTDQYLKPSQLKPYPRTLTTYKKRTLKRWAKDPKHYDEPQIIIANQAIYCHPSVLQELKAIYAKSIS